MGADHKLLFTTLTWGRQRAFGRTQYSYFTVRCRYACASVLTSTLLLANFASVACACAIAWPAILISFLFYTNIISLVPHSDLPGGGWTNRRTTNQNSGGNTFICRDQKGWKNIQPIRKTYDRSGRIELGKSSGQWESFPLDVKVKGSGRPGERWTLLVTKM